MPIGMRRVLVLLAVCLLADAAMRKEKDRKKDKLKSLPSRNPCGSEEPEAPMTCFCDNDNVPGKVTSAQCWVFGPKLSKDYPVWGHFAMQPRITTLRLIDRTNGNISFVPTKALVHLKELRTFDIGYGAIGEIHAYAFANLSQLTELKLTRNQIATLSHHAFAHLQNLSELNLDENRISELQRDVFVDLPVLQKLFIISNNLSVIEEGTFRNLAKLLELELSYNLLSVLTKDTFSGLGELKRLDLSNNKLSMLGDLTFAELWVLEELLLESNQIELIADRAFAGLTHLKRLNLSHNKLVILSPTLLGGVPGIYSLDLRSNLLETLTLDNVRPIIHNLYNETSYFHLEENNLICDCRLAWMYNLRNETKNENVRSVIDKLICYLEPETDDDDDDDDDFGADFAAKQRPAVPGGNAFPTNEHFDYDADDTYDHQQDSSNNYVTEQQQQQQDPYARHLLEIPVGELRCPQKENPTEQTLLRNLMNTPSYAEINSSGGSARIGMLMVLLLTAIFVAT